MGRWVSQKCRFEFRSYEGRRQLQQRFQETNRPPVAQSREAVRFWDERDANLQPRRRRFLETEVAADKEYTYPSGFSAPSVK